MVNRKDILKDVLFKMNYDPSKTLVENTRLMEQPEGVMDRRTGITAQNAKELGMTQSEYEKKLQQQSSENVKEFGDFIYEYRHGLMDIASVGTFFIPVVGPLISLSLYISSLRVVIWQHF